MATRDLTRMYLELRTDAKAKILRRKNMMGYADEEGILQRKGGHGKWDKREKGDSPPWVHAVEETDRYVAHIKELVDNLNKLHTKRLMVRFDGSESQNEQEIEHMTREITQEFRKAEKVLKSMDSKSQDDMSAADAKAHQNVKTALATQLQALSSDFRKSQKQYLLRVKNQKQGPVDFDFLSESSAVGKRAAMEMGFDQAQMTEVDIAEDIINERDAEIQKIATSITELATIFKELAVLVIDQGTILDRIDYNMEQVVEQTEKGVLELEKAEQTQKSGGPMKCIGLLLGLIFLMTAVLVLKHS